MATPLAKLDVFKVKNDLQSSHFSCKTLEAILKKKSIDADICEQDDGWLIRIDCYSTEILSQEDYILLGKYHRKPYYLTFSTSSEQFPEQEVIQSENKESKDNTKKKPFETPPCVGQDREPQQQFRTCELDEETEQPTSQSEPRTILVHDVPKTVDSEAVRLYFKNPKSSKGGKITAFEIDKKNEIKITFESSADIEKLKILCKECTNAYLSDTYPKVKEVPVSTQIIQFPEQEDIQSENKESKVEKNTENKQPFETPPCVGQDRKPRQQFRTCELDEETEQPTSQSEPRTIIVHGVPKTVDFEELQLYFENPKSSKGGKITSFEIDKKNEIKITFESSAVARAVLEKDSHVFSNNKLRVSMYMPPQMEDKMVVISDFKPNITKEPVKNFLEAKIPAEMEIESVKKVKNGTFLVYFAEKIDIEKLKILCKKYTNAYLSDTYPKVKEVPVPTQIIVSNSDKTKTKESVKNFFLNPLARDDFVGIKELPANKFVITFKNSDLAKKMSQVNIREFKINLYHDWESSNETYKEISLPSPFLLNFIKDNKNVFEDELKDYGYLDLSKSNGNLLKIMCDNDKEDEINKRVEELLALINEEKVTIPSDLFDELKDMHVKDKNLNIYFDKENLAAHIFSFNKSSSSNCKENISKFIEQRFNAMKKVLLESHKIILLFSDFFPSKIFRKYKKVKITVEGSNVVFCGFSPDIDKVISEMFKYLSDIKVTQIQLPRNSNAIINKKEVKQYLLEKVKEKKCPCSWEINPDNQVFLYTPKNVDAESVKEILCKSIVELNFHLNGPKRNILKEKIWLIKLQDLSNKYADNFQIDVKNNKLSVVTTAQIATEIESELEKFFHTNAVYRKKFPLKLGVYNFLMRFERSVITNFVNQRPPLEIQFENDQVIQIFGTKQLNVDASSFLQNLITGVFEQKETFLHLGFKKFLKTDLADTVLEKISKLHKCLILRDGDAATTLGNTSTYQIKYANSEIILQLKDITELDVDAIVNPANKDLKHVGGLSLAIIQKGGAMIQEECNDIMKKTGRFLNEGAVKVTSAGNLRCRFIMHAVGPVWKDGNNYEFEFLSEAVTNALDEAERRNLNSIAIPAICTGTLGFPINKATEVIVGSIKNYLDNNPNTKLKSIYLISLKNNIINAFHNQLNSTFPKSTKKATSGPSEQTKPPMKSRTNIEIEFGLLNQTQCDVIVNTTNKKLDLYFGQISKALLADAGPKLQEECDSIQHLSVDDVAVTGGYNLPCKAVFHIFLPPWHESSVQQIKRYTQNCLRKADQEKYSHIAFPALGTGVLGYPPDVVANEMVRATLEYISTERTALQNISFVIYPGKNDLYQAFENAKGMEPSISMTNAPTYQPNVNKNTATPMSRQGDKLDMDMQGIKLIVQKGNLIDQTTDAIVHGTNQQFNLMGAISQVILKEIGPQFTNDCKAKVSRMKVDNYALTPGHSLRTSWILHVNIKGIRNNASQIFKKCFDAAESNQLTSLAVPPIGTGRLGCSVKYFSDHFMKSLGDFAKSSPKHLKTVVIVAFDQGIFADICQEIGNKGNTSRFTSPSVGANARRFAEKTEKFVSKETEPSAVNLFIYAKNLDTIKKVKAEIDSKYMKDYLQEKEITDDTIKKLSQKQKKQIHELQNEHDVKIEFQHSSINVSGYKDDFVTVTGSIFDLLMIASKEINSFEMTNSLVQWSYMTTTNNKPEIVPYPLNINHQLEKAYEKKQTKLEIPGSKGGIIFDFSDPKNMIEYNENTKGFHIKVLRKDLTKSAISLPEYWDPMGDEDYLKVELKPGTEFDTVQNKFPTNFTIIKIERIQRKSLYIQYQVQLQKMNAINPKHVQNETRDLWHGTSEGATENINKSGFDRGHCGKNATAYGNGVYFAKDAQYSLSDTYSPPNSNGYKHLYLCNVLTGMFCKGDSKMEFLPPNPNISDRPYDSAVDNVNNPTMFVTFHDVNAYPAYLITCL